MAYGGLPLDKMSEMTFDFVCTACERENKTFEAIKYCVECMGYCCQPCLDLHSKFPSLKGHTFLDVGQGSQADTQSARLPEFPTEQCKIHSGKIMDLYCGYHDSVGCGTCMVTDHKSCNGKQIHSIPDMLDVLYSYSDSHQTHDRLRQMIVSITTLDKSKDALLKAIHIAKKEAINQVGLFENILHSILKKAGEASKQEVEEESKHLEEELLQDKQSLTNTNDILIDTEKKVYQTVANRAQHFVSTSIAKKVLKDAELVKQKISDGNDIRVQILFNLNESLINYIQNLPNIGHVQVLKKRTHSLYELKGSKDINMKGPSDSNECWCYGCCIAYDNKFIVTDFNNKKLKQIDILVESVVQECKLDSYPTGICCVPNQHEVAVACSHPHRIQFVSIQDDSSMIPTRHIDTDHIGYGIASNANKLYVTDQESSIHIYNMTGTFVRSVSRDKSGNKIFSKIKNIAINESGDLIFVADWNKGIVFLNEEGSSLSAVNDNDSRGVCGVCVDNRGSVFVTVVRSNNVVQYTEDGKKVGVVVSGKTGLHRPIAVCYHQGLNRLFVTQWYSDVLKMYELE